MINQLTYNMTYGRVTFYKKNKSFKSSIIHETIILSYFIENDKLWVTKLIEYLPNADVDKIINTPIPMNDIQDKIIWKFFNDSKFSVKLPLWK